MSPGVKKWKRETANPPDNRKSPDQKKAYILEHLGVMSIENMAKNLECSQTRIYQILRDIRKDRDGLIATDLVSTAAEEQYNRLNTACKLAFSTLMRAYTEAQRPDTELNDSRLYTYSSIYVRAEGALTQFMKALGLYAPDINVVANNTGPSVTVIFEDGLESPAPSPAVAGKVAEKGKTEHEVNPRKEEKVK